MKQLVLILIIFFFFTINISIVYADECINNADVQARLDVPMGNFGTYERIFGGTFKGADYNDYFLANIADGFSLASTYRTFIIDGCRVRIDIQSKHDGGFSTYKYAGSILSDGFFVCVTDSDEDGVPNKDDLDFKDTKDSELGKFCN